jgi:hypothetical protein
MKNIFIICLLLMLTACGDQVTIFNGEKGKQLTTSGLESIIREPGTFRMDVCFTSACPKLVRLQTSFSAHTIHMDKIFLPISNVTVDDVTFGIQFRVKEDKASINEAFSTRAENVKDGTFIITSEMMYDTYIARKAPEVVIDILREYSIDDVLSNVSEISKQAKAALNKELESTPIEITEFGFPNGVGTPPKVVLDAKERLYAVNEERARKLRELEAQLAIESQRQAVQAVRARNDAAIAKELGIPTSEFMLLKTIERFADAADEGTPIALGGGILPICKSTK